MFLHVFRKKEKKMGNFSEMAENCSALQTGVAPTIEFYLEVQQIVLNFYPEVCLGVLKIKRYAHIGVCQNCKNIFSLSNHEV